MNLIQKKYLILGCLLFVLHAFLRLTHPENFMFDYDQEIIANKAWEIGREHRFTLIGMRVGTYPLYVGPLYFYVTTLFFILFHYHPLALLYSAFFWSVVTLVALFYLGKILRNSKTGMVLAFLYSTSPLIVYLDRIAWNPNPLFFLSTIVLMMLFLIARSPRSKTWWFFTLGSAVGFGLNCHFSAVLLGIIAVSAITALKKWSVRNLMAFILPLIVLILPLVIFDIRHNWLNSRGLILLIKGDSREVVGVTEKIGSIVLSGVKQAKIVIENQAKIIVGSVRPPLLNYAIGGLVLTYGIRKITDQAERIILGLFLGIPLLVFTFYSGSVPEYYYSISFPALCVISALLVTKLRLSTFDKNVWGSFIVILMVCINFQKINHANGQSLSNKMAVLEDIKNHASGSLKIEYAMPHEWSFGYGYLIRYLNVPSDPTSSVTYTIMYPVTPTTQRDRQHGLIGLTLPQ